MKTSQIITAKMRTKSFASQLRRAFRFTVLPHGFRKNILATRNDRNIQILPILWHGKTFVASQWFVGFSQSSLKFWRTLWRQVMDPPDFKLRPDKEAKLGCGFESWITMCKKGRKGWCNAGNAWREYRIMYIIIYNSIHEYCIRVVCCPHGDMNPHELRCKDSSCRVVSKVQPEGLADQCLFSRADLCSTNQRCYFFFCISWWRQPRHQIAPGLLADLWLFSLFCSSDLFSFPFGSSKMQEDAVSFVQEVVRMLFL